MSGPALAVGGTRLFDKHRTGAVNRVGGVTKWCSRVGGPGTVLMFSGLILANLVAWAWAFSAFADRPAVMATALLAWAFGLRHAVDADHIAAIDNVVRKLMHAGGAPRSAGLHFALGHSSVVVVATMLLVAGAVSLGGDSLLNTVGSLIGTSVSAIFLLAIAAINLVIFVSLWRTTRVVRANGVHDAEKLDALLANRGFLARVLAPMFRMVTKSWHMYPLGFLFGLGFDTATEIGLLSLSASEAARGVSLSHVMVFPALFAAGMALVDTADSTLMVSAYRWAFVDPLRKLWYNLTITGASIVVALFIGGVEALGLICRRLGLGGDIWSLVASLDASLANFGFVVIGLFVIAWLVSIAVYRIAFAGGRWSRSLGRTESSALGGANATEVA